jgi:hypothetical protein
MPNTLAWRRSLSVRPSRFAPAVAFHLGTLIVCFALVMSVTFRAEGPTTKTAAAKKPAARTAWGDPDLTGIWTGSTITPLERPDQFAGKEFLTEEEAAALEKRALESRADGPPPAGDPGTYNQVWFDPASKVVPSRRTSLITDPRDGKIPFTAVGRAAQLRARGRYGKGPFNSALDLDTGERCLTDGLPLYFSGYNNNYQFFQSPSSIVILHELYHEARVIYTDGRPHSNIRRWLGDSRGHWEGNTLVVDTANFLPRERAEWQDAWRASRSTTHLIERFTRVDAETMEYQFTWEDPTMFVRPWTAAWPLTTNQASRGVTEGGIFEYACHEGNYAMTTVLEGAREEEAEAVAPVKDESRDRR